MLWGIYTKKLYVGSTLATIDQNYPHVAGRRQWLPNLQHASRQLHMDPWCLFKGRWTKVLVIAKVRQLLRCQQVKWRQIQPLVRAWCLLKVPQTGHQMYALTNIPKGPYIHSPKTILKALLHIPKGPVLRFFLGWH